MKNFMVEFARTGGFCCVYRFLRTIRRYQTALLARFYGVDVRTIRRWKAQRENWGCPCAGLPQGVRQMKGWAPCMRGKEVSHPLDDTTKRAPTSRPG